MMMLVETMLQHALLLILLILLVSNLSFCRHFMGSACDVLPWLFWRRSAEEDEDVLATSFGDLPMMHRLSSAAGSYMHPEDLRRRHSMVGARSTSLGKQQSAAVGGRQSHTVGATAGGGARTFSTHSEAS